MAACIELSWLQVPYDNVSKALEAGKKGQVWGMIHFGHNFSEEFEIRQDAGDSATVENIIRSKISINMDSTSKMTQTWFAVNLLI